MKRAERHHLKENEIERLARQAQELFDSRKQELSWAIAAIVIVAAAGLGWVAWRQHVQTTAGAALADAMAIQDARIGPPPAPGTPSTAPYFPTERERAQAVLTKFKAAADAYPVDRRGYLRTLQAGDDVDGAG